MSEGAVRASGGEAKTVELMLSHPLEDLEMTIVQLLILILTGDNYPQIMWQGARCRTLTCTAAVSSVYFVCFIILGNIIIMSVLTAVIFDFYKRHHALIVLKEKVKEKKALVAAFVLMDSEGSGLLAASEMRRMLRIIRPQASRASLDAVISTLDADHNGSIDVHEFVVLSEVIMLQV